MKKEIKKIFSYLIFLQLLLCAYLHSETFVAGKYYDGRAQVASVVQLLADLKYVSNNMVTGNTIIDFSTGAIVPPVGKWQHPTRQYIAVRVIDNAVAWRLRVCTKNFESQPSTVTWGFQYGGLVGTSVQGAKAPMAWRCSDTVYTPPIVVGNPTVEGSGWLFVKDKYDVDDPGSQGKDESFTSADTDGYTNVAYGSTSFTRIIQPELGQSQGYSKLLPSPNSEFYLYFGADFSEAAAAIYRSSLRIELINR